MTILDEIFAHKRLEVARCKQHVPLAVVRAEAEKAVPANFDLRTLHPGIFPLIAEVKKASPSKGLLAPDFDPLRLARIYQQNGAAAISVLTDEKYFQGSLDLLRQIAAIQPRLPLLRKDFICDAYQVYEARAAGADAVLLIAASLDEAQLAELHGLATELGMAALVEVHDQAELAKALRCGPKLVGINNRDLRDFSVNLETTLRLRPFVPPGITVVAESGIHVSQDIARLREAGVHAALVGEALVTAKDVGAKVRELCGVGDEVTG